MPSRFIVFLILGNLLPASAQTLPPRLKQTLTAQLKASEESLHSLENGGIVTYAMETDSPGVIRLVGMVRIWATPAAFVEAYRNIASFESAAGITATQKFSTPPVAKDLDSISLSPTDAADLQACTAGKCTLKIDDAGLNAVGGDANRAVRGLWLQYLKNYQAKGNAGLPIYHDSPEYFAVAKGFTELLESSGALRDYAPQLAGYLRDYPRSKTQPTANFFYWQLGSFGLKPVHRLTHVAIQRISGTFGEAYVIANKMLYASHYFRSGLEVRYLIPGQDQRSGGMHYLILEQSSHVDGMEGWRGSLLRPVVVQKSLTAMQQYLSTVKDKFERKAAGEGAAGK